MKTWIEDRQEIEAILESALVGRLGLATEDGPYIVPLNFAHNDGRIYFHSGLEGRKWEAIQKSSRVCFEVDELHEVVPHEHACLFTTHYRSVIIWGTARLLEDNAAKAKGLELLLRKYAPGKKYEPLPEEALAAVNVCEIQIERMTAKANLPDAAD